jgi:hypothetical protein
MSRGSPAVNAARWQSATVEKRLWASTVAFVFGSLPPMAQLLDDCGGSKRRLKESCKLNFYLKLFFKLWLTCRRCWSMAKRHRGKVVAAVERGFAFGSLPPTAQLLDDCGGSDELLKE